jgi:predicted CoA-substrate-specific enzyme activase
MPVVAGVDIGSITAKTVTIDEEKRILSAHVIHQGIVNEEAAWTCLQTALAKAGLRREDLSFLITTGYGRDLVTFGDHSITEITCHAAGVHHLLPEVRTVIDVGGQDSKVIALDEQGRVATFRMNDKCAAGTGRFLEVMARALGVELTALGATALQSRDPAPVSSVCTVFAESEVVSLAARGFPKVDIVGGIHEAIANRLSSMVRAVGAREPIVMTGGVAMNQGVVRALERTLGIQIVVPPEPQIIGALGAALFALQKAPRWAAADGAPT